METPTNNRSKPCISSSQKKARNSLDNSASKLVRNLIYRDKIRKLNQYKLAKNKRTELLIRNRHIENQKNIDLEEKIEIDDSSPENDFKRSQNNKNQSEKYQIQTNYCKLEPLSEINQSVLNNTVGIGSKFSSRIDTFKNSIKNIDNLNDSKAVRSMNQNLKQQNDYNSGSKTNTLRRSISIGGFSGHCHKKKNSHRIKPLKKQESTSSLHGQISSLSDNSKIPSSSSLSFRLHHNSLSSLSSKPVFKVSTKIQYNDAHLYINVIIS